MHKIISIDYGQNRCGIAISTENNVMGLCTVQTKKIFNWFENYLKTNEIDYVIIGYPQNTNGTDTHATNMVIDFISNFQLKFNIEIKKVDERFSSQQARKRIVALQTNFKVNGKKAFIDEIAATIILERYLKKINLISKS